MDIKSGNIEHIILSRKTICNVTIIMFIHLLQTSRPPQICVFLTYEHISKNFVNFATIIIEN